MKGFNNDKKNTAQIVVQSGLIFTEKPAKTNNDFVVIIVVKHLFGVMSVTKNFRSVRGSKSGLKKVILFGSLQANQPGAEASLRP